MTFLILTEAERDALARVNAESPDRQLAPVPLPDGRWALNADVLDDSDYWGRHLAALAGVNTEQLAWRSAGGKVAPADEAGKAVVTAALAGVKSALATAELDLNRDFYKDEAKVNEVAARYVAERARVEASLAAVEAVKAVKEGVVETADGK